MEFSLVTRLLLWLLSKRPDVGELLYQEPSSEQELPEHSLDLDFEQFYELLSHDDRINYLNACHHWSIDD